MSDWKEKIEERIAHMNDPHGRYSMKNRFDDAATIQALLDVAVAADKYIWSLKHGKTTEAMNCYCDGLNAALDKLREAGDE